MVGFLDRLPAGERRAVEHQALGEGLLFDHADVEGHMLPLAARIGETQVDVFDVVVLDRFQDVFGGLHEYPFWLTGRRERAAGRDRRSSSIQSGEAQYNIRLSPTSATNAVG